MDCSKDQAWRTGFAQADERRRNPPALDEYTRQSACSTAIMGTRVETSYAIVPVAKFMEMFQATPQELALLTIETFDDVDGTKFDGVVMKDQLTSKRLHVWIEHRAELIDHALPVENHLRPGQGAEMQTTLQASLLQARPKKGQGAEGRSQPPTLEEIRDMVQRGRGAGMVLGRGAVDDGCPGEESDGSADERERVVEFSTVTPSRAPAPGAGASGSQGKRQRPGGAWSSSKRSRGPALASSSSSSRAERRIRPEVIDGGDFGEDGDALSIETAKLDIADIFLQQGVAPKQPIYNMAGA